MSFVVVVIGVAAFIWVKIIRHYKVAMQVATPFIACLTHYKVVLNSDVARLHAYLPKNGSRRLVKKYAFD